VNKSSTYDPMVGSVLDDRYEILAKLARGGMATVYRARDRRLQRTVAVKIMRTDLGEDDEFAAKFDREARSAALINHPAVVSIFDQGISRGQPYIVMEFIDGETLRRLIARDAPLEPVLALDYLEPIASALAAAHDAGIVHRDIKPENVMISTRGHVKVADFGLARQTESPQMTATGVLVGTASYLPPELVTHARPDSRSDIYSTGIVLFELLTGKKPHVGENNYQIAYAHVNIDVPAPSAKLRELGFPGFIPDYLDALVAVADGKSRRRPEFLRRFNVHWIADQAPSLTFAHALRLHCAEDEGTAAYWWYGMTLNRYMDPDTDPRAVEELMARTGCDRDSLIESFRTYVFQETDVEVSWAWFAERPGLLREALGRSDSVVRALEILGAMPRLPVGLSAVVADIAVGDSKVNRPLAQAVLHCCQMKAAIVAQDETEQGARALLNLGHTFGHAIEAEMGYGNWLHGEAVAAGCVLACLLSERLGSLKTEDTARVRALMRQAKLPDAPPVFAFERWLAHMRHDKKVESGTMRFVTLSALGRAVLTPLDDVQILRDALQPFISD